MAHPTCVARIKGAINLGPLAFDPVMRLLSGVFEAGLVDHQNGGIHHRIGGGFQCQRLPKAGGGIEVCVCAVVKEAANDTAVINRRAIVADQGGDFARWGPVVPRRIVRLKRAAPVTCSSSLPRDMPS